MLAREGEVREELEPIWITDMFLGSCNAKSNEENARKKEEEKKWTKLTKNSPHERTQ